MKTSPASLYEVPDVPEADCFWGRKVIARELRMSRQKLELWAKAGKLTVEIEGVRRAVVYKDHNDEWWAPKTYVVAYRRANTRPVGINDAVARAS